MTKETKTLKELNVKPGDVVACWNGYHKGTEFTINDNWGKWSAAGDPWWIIVSRAAGETDDSPKLWKDMSPEEKGALLLAHHEGKEIENNATSDGRFFAAPPLWDDQFAYRVKPEPVVEIIRLMGADYGKGMSVSWSFRQNGHIGKDTHRITFNLIDGKPDCNSVKMEEI